MTLLQDSGFSKEELETYKQFKDEIGNGLDEVLQEYLNKGINLSCAFQKAHDIFPDMHPYTIDFVFVMECIPFMQKEYERRALPYKMLVDTVADFNCKLHECLASTGVYGTAVGWWFDSYIFLKRLTFSRLQYDIKEYDGEKVTFGNNTLEKGDFVLDCHIHSNGPLLEKDCIASYREAWEFFKDDLKDGTLPIICWSWLLNPDYMVCFGENSNIGKFARHFHIYRTDRDEKLKTEVLSHVFNTYSVTDIEKLPDTTSLQRKFKEYLKTNKPFGNGAGIILFDGENILTQR